MQNKNLTGNRHIAIYEHLKDKAKLAARRGQESSGLLEIAGLPGKVPGYFF
jgi:hypothetical protein